MEKNHSIKARMYLGGLKSLFADMHDMIEGVEKTGNMPSGMLQNLVDTKEAIDLTLQQLKKATVQCCEHDDSCEDEDEDEDEDEELYCEDCDLSLADCDCEDEDYEEPEPEPEPKTATRKPSKKEKVAVPSPTVTPVPSSKKNKKETRH